jgi:hypothetical protein
VTEPLVTAMVSTYASERYLRGCLDDLLAQTMADRLEIVVVDACSPEREGEIVRAYQRDHGNIRYLRTETRECTSAAFHRATAMARGRYLTTANTDDRHHPEFVARMVTVLEQMPTVGLVYADTAISTRDNETWHDSTATQRFAWPDYTPAAALSIGVFGPQPMWRRAAHERAGDWSMRWKIANDLDLFLRIARAHGAVHLAEVLGLFLQRSDSNSGVGRARAVLDESLAVFREQRRSWSIDEIVPGATSNGPYAEAAAWFELGNLCALGPYTDAQAALDCYRAGLALPMQGVEQQAVRTAFANNSACILACAGAGDTAARAFALLPPSAARGCNMQHARARDGKPPQLRDLKFLELDHAVVRQARRTHGVVVDAHGIVQATPSHELRPWEVFEGPTGVPWRRTSLQPAN